MAAVRTYGFVTIVNDPAWASVVGHVESYETASGSHEYTLHVTEQQARYANEAIVGGCGLSIRFQTRATTGALGNGSAWFDGTVQVDGAGWSTSITESGIHPLPECDIYALICQTNEVYTQALVAAPSVGEVLTVSATATATADAGTMTQFDQAHADWRVRYPALLIPIR